MDTQLYRTLAPPTAEIKGKKKTQNSDTDHCVAGQNRLQHLPHVT